MRKVLFISHSRGIHGAEMVMLRAIRACVEAGARVTVVVPSVVDDEGLEDTLGRIAGVEVMRMPYRAGGASGLRTRIVQIYNIPTLCHLAQYVRKAHIDTIYSNTTVTILGASLARVCGVKHVWHWHEPVDMQFGWNASMASVYRPLAVRADQIVCISRQQKEEWEKELGMRLENAQIIYNPIKRIVPISSGVIEKRKDVRIGFIGHFEARKNIELLIRVFERIHMRKRETRLMLCGAIGEKDRQFVESLTALREPEVCVLPQTSEVEKFYGAIDILVLPSWRETMPLVVLEAMQAGVCVLQTNRSGMNELLEDGQDSLFFSPENADEFEDLLSRCMDESYRRKIATTGQKKALQLVNNQQFDKQIQSLLCE